MYFLYIKFHESLSRMLVNFYCSVYIFHNNVFSLQSHSSHFDKWLCLHKIVTSDAHILFRCAVKLWYFAVWEFFHSNSSAFVYFVQFTNPSYGGDFTSWCLVIGSSYNIRTPPLKQVIRPTACHAAVAWTDIRTPLHELTLNYFVLVATPYVLHQKPTSESILCRCFPWNWPPLLAACTGFNGKFEIIKGPNRCSTFTNSRSGIYQSVWRLCNELETDESGLILGRGKRFLFYLVSRPAVGSS
jgi:hypothetical protein